jgi:hypothetical protein
MVIHVHKAEYMRVQRCNAYRYSVESEDSPYYQELGRLYATRDISLNPGHRYNVRVNNDTRNPWIEELYGEGPAGAVTSGKLSSAVPSERGRWNGRSRPARARHGKYEPLRGEGRPAGKFAPPVSTLVELPCPRRVHVWVREGASLCAPIPQSARGCMALRCGC